MTRPWFTRPEEAAPLPIGEEAKFYLQTLCVKEKNCFQESYLLLTQTRRNGTNNPSACCNIPEKLWAETCSWTGCAKNTFLLVIVTGKGRGWRFFACRARIWPSLIYVICVLTPVVCAQGIVQIGFQ